jgi:6,7-dimethyl-8-ribityllumazine synthase
MATALQNLSDYKPFTLENAKDFKIGIVTAEWNEHITGALSKGARSLLLAQGIQAQNIVEQLVPGSYELPLAAQWLANSGCHAVIAIGCLIKGETPHFEYISEAVAHGLMDVNLRTGKPIAFGVITVLNEAQALDRAGGQHGNKGIEAAVTVLRMLKWKQNLQG